VPPFNLKRVDRGSSVFGEDPVPDERSPFQNPPIGA